VARKRRNSRSDASGKNAGAHRPRARQPKVRPHRPPWIVCGTIRTVSEGALPEPGGYSQRKPRRQM